MKRLWPVLFCGVCAFAGGAAVCVLPRMMPSAARAETPPVPGKPVAPDAPPAGPTVLTPEPAPAAGDVLLRLSERFEATSKRVSPAVVSVEAIKPAPPSASGKSRNVEESGSGVMIAVEGGKGGLVITNNHVVGGAKPEQITVSLADDRLFRPTQVWADPESDVALLRIETDERLATAPLGDSDQVRVGQWVLAFGSPFGLNQTLTHGIISARGRGQVSLGDTIRIKDFLQTDAAINPGSSGGPLVNLDGEVIGINTAIASQSGSNSGVAFAIPINLVKRVSRQLLERGSVTRGYLGVQLASVMDPAEALRLGLDRARGALVEAVHPDTPAALAGLKANDVVLQVDGESVRNENHLINLIAIMPVGKKVRMQVWRERKAVALDATVGDWTAAKGRFKSQ